MRFWDFNSGDACDGRQELELEMPGTQTLKYTKQEKGAPRDTVFCTLEGGFYFR